MKLEILYLDEHLVAVNKPSGLLVHKSPIDKAETEFALQLVRDQIGQYVYPIHRLDKPTSGVLIFALSSEVARLMAEAFKAHEVQKEYMAVVRGYTKKHELINYDLKVILDKKADKDRSDNKEPQEAKTYYESLATVELPYAVSRYSVARYSLLRLIPKTGRKHQLRRHMKHILHPIVGDTKYGRNEHNNLFREKFDCHRLLLHSSKTSFLHPITKKQIVIEAGFDEVFTRVLSLFI
ncbi:tRNA pseudouridine(65) synthase TruC [bacterium]|nr:tRNA pseudouridine(65) synthase TruC [bacterium]MBU1957541.1 tRNA pseudouridine(65) synthase TruC [bacterium]